MGSIYFNDFQFAIGEAKGILDLRLLQTPIDQRDDVKREKILALTSVSKDAPLNVKVDLDKDHPDLSHLPLQLFSKNIQGLQLDRMEGIVSLDGFPITSPETDSISKNDTLKVFLINNTTLQNLNGLPSELSKLETMVVDGSKLDSLSGFPLMPNLETLILKNNSLQSLKGLPRFPNLKKLEIGANNLEDLDGLSIDQNIDIEIGERGLRSYYGLTKDQFFTIVKQSKDYGYRSSSNNFSLKSKQLLEACTKTDNEASEECSRAYNHMSRSVPRELENLELPMVDFDKATKSAIFVVDEMDCAKDLDRLNNSLQIYDHNLKKRNESDQIKGKVLIDLIKDSYKMKCDVDL